MTFRVQFTDSAMESHVGTFKSRINMVVRRHLGHLPKSELSEKEDLFKTWMEAKDKESVSFCYKDRAWRALYSRILYKARIMTVLHTFEQIQKRSPGLVNSLEAVSSFVSIGCGPGPEVAALYMILHASVGVRRTVDALAVDQYGEWREYIESLNRVPFGGQSTNVRFQALRVDEYSIVGVKSADICIMSYTDAAMHTSLFWRRLKEKYRLVVVLDQRHPRLTQILLGERYQMVEYEFKETKRFFFWMSPEGIIATEPLSFSYTAEDGGWVGSLLSWAWNSIRGFFSS